MRQAAAMLLLVLAAPLPAVAADLDIKPQPATPAPAPSPTTTIFTPPDATCLEWTDGCRVCVKPVAGEATCSNVGAACTAQAPRCTRR